MPWPCKAFRRGPPLLLNLAAWGLASQILFSLALQASAQSTAPSFSSSDGKPVDLGFDSFDKVLKEKLEPNQPCVIEFFASWCPACRHFAPEYEKVAQYLHKTDKGATFVGRVDCAKEAKLCEQFKVKAYPSVTTGPASAYAARQLGELKHYGRGGRTAKAVTGWLGEVMKRPYSYTEGKEDREKEGKAVAAVAAAGPAANLPLWTRQDVLATTQELFSQIMTNSELHKGPAKRAALLALAKAWGAGHAVESCQAGAQRLVAMFDVLWPEAEDVAPPALRAHAICGSSKGGSSGGQQLQPQYVACNSSRPNARGFTCGLWLLFHTGVHRVPAQDGDSRGVATTKAMLEAFGRHFFLCAPCQAHFSKMLGGQDFNNVGTLRDMALWLWQAHNHVNSRLAFIESKYGHSSSGDPVFPKLQWPGKDVCPPCHRKPQPGGVEPNATHPLWDSFEVFKFLERSYGGEPPAWQQVAAATGSSSGSSRLRGGPEVQDGRAASGRLDPTPSTASAHQDLQPEQRLLVIHPAPRHNAHQLRYVVLALFLVGALAFLVLFRRPSSSGFPSTFPRPHGHHHHSPHHASGGSSRMRSVGSGGGGSGSGLSGLAFGGSVVGTSSAMGGR